MGVAVDHIPVQGGVVTAEVIRGLKARLREVHEGLRARAEAVLETAAALHALTAIVAQLPTPSHGLQEQLARCRNGRGVRVLEREHQHTL